MKRMYTCIICPNGCDMEAEIDGKNLLFLTGHLCAKGIDYVTQELTDPRRTIASSVKVTGGTLPLTSVRVTNSIPKDMIFHVMNEINKRTLEAPVSIGQVVIANVLNLNSDVIVTKNVPAIRD